jgi:ATP-dependent Lon protease
MSKLEDLSFHSERFSGKARLFPLPNLVMFPHVMQPLHIFEPRYRALMADALAGDQLLAMTMLAPGWENDCEGRPPLLPIGCLARVASYQQQPDDRYNVLLLGLRRVRLIAELAPTRPFREAQVEILADEYPPSGGAARPALQHSLVKTFQKLLPQLDLSDQLEELLGNNLPLGVLTDIVAYALDLDVAAKEALLAEQNVDQRAAALLKHLSPPDGNVLLGRLAGFPPKFSVN